MAGNLDDMFSNKETCNWFKASIALIITKQGLEKFVDSEIQKLHANVGRACGNCLTQNLIQCPTSGVCRNARSCSFHNAPGLLPRPCPMKICDQVKQNIASHHRYSNPSWKNTRAVLWAANHWEIAKCYLPPDGYIDVASVQGTDFNGVICVLLNCTHFDTCFSFSIAPRSSPECILTQVRQIGRDVRHTSTCRVADSDLQNIFLTLQSLISDPVSLANDPNASSAINKLGKLKNNTQFIINPDELLEHLKDAHQNLVKINDKSETLSKEMDMVLDEIDTHMKECIQRIKERELEASERISKEGEQVLTKIQSQTLVSITSLDEKATLLQERIVKEAKQGIEQLRIDSAMAHYDQGLEELRRRLVQHYNNTLKHVALSPLNPSFDSSTTLDNLYATAKIFRIRMNKPTLKKHDNVKSIFQKKDEQAERNEISLYKDLFDTNGKLNGRIFLEGDAGTGKTTFVAKLVLDWCKVFQLSCKTDVDETDFNDFASLARFSFVFLVTLRDSIGEREVPKMIKEQIIDMVYFDDDREKAYILLQRIMEREKCPVVQDGLDEWTAMKGKLAQPLMVGCHNQCTLLTTTRSWKLADERIRDSQIDGLFLLDGVKDVFTLCRMVPKNSYYIHDLFEQNVKSNKLEELLSEPLLLKKIVSLWAEDERVDGSICKLFSILLDGLLKKVSDEVSFFPNPPVLCFQNTRYVHQNIDHLDAISMLAFYLLFSLEKEFSLVFTDRQIARYGFEPHKTFSLTSGLLTERKRSAVAITSSTFSFANKSMQEFLAAYYIVRNKNVIDDVVSKYLDHFPEDLFSISQTFVFVCGLDIQAAYALSCLMDDRMTTADFYTFQDLIIAGFMEAKDNNTKDLIKLKISDIDLDAILHPLFMENGFPPLLSIYKGSKFMQMRHSIECLFDFNKANLRRLDIGDVYVTEIGNHFLSEELNLTDILLSSAHCLEHLDITFRKIVLSSSTNTKTPIRMDVFVTDPKVITKLQKLKIFTLRYSSRSLDATDTFPIEMLFPWTNQSETTFHDIQFPSSLANEDIDLPSAKAYQEINLSSVTAFQEINLPSALACHDTSLPSSIENITLAKITVSAVWLSLLLKKLSLFDHHVNITLEECFIQSVNADEQKDLASVKQRVSESQTYMCVSNVLSVNSYGDSEGLYDSLMGMNIHRLFLYHINKYG
ncbi:uncharacterized protein LOC127869388 [Dreissena polymorpha]|uniref:NACHT domain-containing protein n=1 Tax=Dreissena polymorpha TaxID=45954 RepID=A0A9D4RQG9_DREPO|nr:uncharacterized protein LOC127869388 [Dreissena polymorpha]KAH3875368.1 hypothetical protein DPMN_038631 [Dreissena polymorpha]